MGVPSVVDALADVTAEHDEREPCPTDGLEPCRVQGVGQRFDVRGGQVVGVAAPVVPGQDEGGVRPSAGRYHRVDFLPDQVVTFGEVGGIGWRPEWGVFIEPGRAPHVAQTRQRAGRHAQEVRRPVDTGRQRGRGEFFDELGRVAVLIDERAPRHTGALRGSEHGGEVPHRVRAGERGISERRGLPGEGQQMPAGGVAPRPEVVVTEGVLFGQPRVERHQHRVIDRDRHGRVVPDGVVDPRVAVVGLIERRCQRP